MRLMRLRSRQRPSLNLLLRGRLEAHFEVLVAVAGAGLAPRADEHALPQAKGKIGVQPDVVRGLPSRKANHRETVKACTDPLDAKRELEPLVREWHGPVRENEATAMQLVLFPARGRETAVGEHAMALKPLAVEAESRDLGHSVAKRACMVRLELVEVFAFAVFGLLLRAQLPCTDLQPVADVAEASPASLRDLLAFLFWGSHEWPFA
mmetsp:Transcript_61086/g.154214  ORF Transcript_61086/g.154214 Transcript_61086/m.154214 type:complete len:208 (-) Transcript_61086:125-748(-)